MVWGIVVWILDFIDELGELLYNFVICFWFLL